MQFEIDSDDEEFVYVMASSFHDLDVCPLRESVHKNGLDGCPRYVHMLDMFYALIGGKEDETHRDSLRARINPAYLNDNLRG